ncbi:FHA domain-containing protein [uncultured Microbacterium sp.]|uniref:FHA domain-containing protein n=1 Tax=uncultured Microbacterium sp. TaxID=191216 RepID=UPI002614303C|nr:FHA domain-containing protein [uncultured Microbacterium sp.]
MDALSLFATIAGAVLVIALVLHVWYAIGLSRVIAAHGGEPWRAWVPLVNEAEVFRLGRLDPVRAVLLIVPFVNVYGLVLKATAANRLGRASGRGAGTTALAVVLPPAWAMVLARTSETTDAEPSARPQIALDESDPAVGTAGPIAAVPGAPAAAAAGGRRGASEHDEPYAPPALPGPREIGAGAQAAIVEPAATTDLAGGAGATATSSSATPATAAPSIAAAAPAAPVTRIPEAVSTGFAAAPPAAADALPSGEQPSDAQPSGAQPDDLTDGRGDHVSETTDSTAERSAGRTDVAAPVDESTQTARPRSRRRGEWTLALPDGASVSLAGRTVVLGRKPSNADEAVQYVAVLDDSRTMSKEHARLDWTVTGWTITDLDSTNGVTLVHDDGRVERLPGGATAPVPTRFRLGDADLRLRPTAG